MGSRSKSNVPSTLSSQENSMNAHEVNGEYIDYTYNH